MNFAPVPYVQGRTIAEVWPNALRCIVATAHWRQLCGQPHIVVDQRGDETYEIQGLQVCITDPLRGMIPKLPKAPGVTAWGDKRQLDRYAESEVIGLGSAPLGFEYSYADFIAPVRYQIAGLLRNDPSTRRAIISIGYAKDFETESPPCLRSVQFLVRNNRLDMITTWRSRDYAGAAATNMYGLIMLQKWVSDHSLIPVGTYTDFSGSAHIRIRDDLWWVEKVIS